MPLSLGFMLIIHFTQDGLSAGIPDGRQPFQRVECAGPQMLHFLAGLVRAPVHIGYIRQRPPTAPS